MEYKEANLWTRSSLKLNGVLQRLLGRRRREHTFFNLSTSRMTFQKPKEEKCDVVRGNGILKEVLNSCPYSEHTMTLSQLNDVYPLSRVNCRESRKSPGMNDDEVTSFLIENGRNIIEPPKRRLSQRILLFVFQFLNTFRLLLLLAALVCFLIFVLDQTRRREMVMAIFLTAVLIMMCVASYVQQGNISKQIRGFQSIIPGECTVQRQGRELRIQANGVARGDLVWMRVGDRVPADCRLLYTHDLRIETSWVTGEVEPLEYHSGTAAKKDSVFESQNVVFAGCSVTSGEGLGLAIRTGNNAVGVFERGGMLFLGLT
ncbi:unnamed protein product [Bursaphelenchus okinawaensis]|uniref:Cation_ATPase_N domain-containing protein n=1 Tax=Bursaphelenchus okinawaensis TaxID=465554 RepID=A0A811K919_9BILA|nr:unnamed protein product [Bursaphelenchus okinawaensis]CAG9095416.1 unnamed protein product [Bursaphelenchus okinawaensis]